MADIIGATKVTKELLYDDKNLLWQIWMLPSSVFGHRHYPIGNDAPEVFSWWRKYTRMLNGGYVTDGGHFIQKPLQPDDFLTFSPSGNCYIENINRDICFDYLLRFAHLREFTDKCREKRDRANTKDGLSLKHFRIRSVPVGLFLNDWECCAMMLLSPQKDCLVITSKGDIHGLR